MSKVKKLPLVVSILSIISNSYSIFNVHTLAMNSKFTEKSEQKDTYENCPFTPEKLFNKVCENNPEKDWKTKFENNTLSQEDKENIMGTVSNWLYGIEKNDLLRVVPIRDMPLNANLKETIDFIILNFMRPTFLVEFQKRHYYWMNENEYKAKKKCADCFDRISRALILYRLARYIKAPFVISFYKDDCDKSFQMETDVFFLSSQFLHHNSDNLFLILPQDEMSCSWDLLKVINLKPKHDFSKYNYRQRYQFCINYLTIYPVLKTNKYIKAFEFPDFFRKKLEYISSDSLNKYFSCEKLNQLLQKIKEIPVKKK